MCQCETTMGVLRDRDPVCGGWGSRGQFLTREALTVSLERSPHGERVATPLTGDYALGMGCDRACN